MIVKVKPKYTLDAIYIYGPYPGAVSRFFRVTEHFWNINQESWIVFEGDHHRKILHYSEEEFHKKFDIVEEGGEG